MRSSVKLIIITAISLSFLGLTVPTAAIDIEISVEEGINTVNQGETLYVKIEGVNNTTGHIVVVYREGGANLTVFVDSFEIPASQVVNNTTIEAPSYYPLRIVPPLDKVGYYEAYVYTDKGGFASYAYDVDYDPIYLYNTEQEEDEEDDARLALAFQLISYLGLALVLSIIWLLFHNWWRDTAPHNIMAFIRRVARANPIDTSDTITSMHGVLKENIPDVLAKSDHKKALNQYKYLQRRRDVTIRRAEMFDRKTEQAWEILKNKHKTLEEIDPKSKHLNDWSEVTAYTKDELQKLKERSEDDQQQFGRLMKPPSPIQERPTRRFDRRRETPGGD